MRLSMVPAVRPFLASMLLAGALSSLGCAGMARGVLSAPQVRLQEIAAAEDGSLSLAIRVMNAATRGVRVERLELSLSLGQAPPVSLSESEARELPPRAVEVYRFRLAAEQSPPLVSLASASSLFWQLKGHAMLDGQRFPIEAEGRLDRVPGRPGSFY